MTEVTKPDELVEYEKLARATFAYFNQDSVWIPKDRQPVRIADMDPEWRYNASRWLERRAEHFVWRYTFGEIYWMSTPFGRAVVGEVDGKALEVGPLLSHFDLMGEHARDAFDDEQALRDRDPVAWIRGTDLYRALVADLPTKPKKLVKLADRARHWSTCPARTGGGDCACELIRIAEENIGPEPDVDGPLT